MCSDDDIISFVLMELYWGALLLSAIETTCSAVIVCASLLVMLVRFSLQQPVQKVCVQVATNNSKSSDNL